MSLFQCQHCGCCENTALASQGCDGGAVQFFDWSGFEERKGKKLCSACAPTKHSNGKPTSYGKWHGRFPRSYLPMGEFHTDPHGGGLVHTKTGREDWEAFTIEQSKGGA